MIPALGTLILNSLTPLTWLSPVQVAAAVAAVIYGVGGLLVLRIVEDPARASTDPVGAARPSHPPFKAAA
jgi:hypothetical protein